jgi:superfamily II DNA or RNA helicase
VIGRGLREDNDSQRDRAREFDAAAQSTTTKMTAQRRDGLPQKPRDVTSATLPLCHPKCPGPVRARKTQGRPRRTEMIRFSAFGKEPLRQR